MIPSTNILKFWGESPKVTISDEGGWLPGIYDSRATARCAFNSLTYNDMYKLNEKICKETSLNRSITMDDLNDYSLGNEHIIN